jgi:hypothetical protein
MTVTHTQMEAADRATRDRSAEALAEREDAFERGDISYAEIFGSEHIAAPVEAALASWRRSMRIAAKANAAAELGVKEAA